MTDTNPFEFAWGVFAVPLKPYKSRIGHVANNEQRVKGEERGGSFFFPFISLQSRLHSRKSHLGKRKWERLLCRPVKTSGFKPIFLFCFSLIPSGTAGGNKL